MPIHTSEKWESAIAQDISRDFLCPETRGQIAHFERIRQAVETLMGEGNVGGYNEMGPAQQSMQVLIVMAELHPIYVQAHIKQLLIANNLRDSCGDDGESMQQTTITDFANNPPLSVIEMYGK